MNISHVSARLDALVSGTTGILLVGTLLNSSSVLSSLEVGDITGYEPQIRFSMHIADLYIPLTHCLARMHTSWSTGEAYCRVLGWCGFLRARFPCTGAPCS